MPCSDLVKRLEAARRRSGGRGAQGGLKVGCRIGTGVGEAEGEVGVEERILEGDDEDNRNRSEDETVTEVWPPVLTPLGSVLSFWSF